MIIEIDINSGFCFGVVYAIEKAEMYLKSHKKLYCLGDIVHNDEEIKRLEGLCLQIINYDKFKNIKTEKVLFRAHGEHPNNYKFAYENNIEVIDASCPIVLRLQMNIRKKYLEIIDKNGQIVIFGKKGHAEVIALSGHACNQAIIVSNIDDLNLIDFNRPIAIFSQTTKSNFEYKKIVDEIKKRIKTDDFYFQDSVCKQVSNRDNDLREFARKHELIIFVSGKKSSNGRFLFDVCFNENNNSFFISDETELKKEWFLNVNKVGITGATSTPMWLMEKIKSFIENQFILL